MRRSSLLTLTALGALVCLIGGTGLFAALSDAARTGTNSVDSAPLAGSADIQLATAQLQDVDSDGILDVACDTFSENLATGFFTAADVTPGYASANVYYCIRNVGSAAVNLAALADELTDIDTDCTGDEALYGDMDCGDSQLGELSGVLSVTYQLLNCSGAGHLADSSFILKDNATVANSVLGSLAPGTEGCFSAQITFPETTAADDVQMAQSDRAAWRFEFTAAS
jgi:hypothetical protein